MQPKSSRVTWQSLFSKHPLSQAKTWERRQWVERKGKLRAEWPDKCQRQSDYALCDLRDSGCISGNQGWEDFWAWQGLEAFEATVRKEEKKKSDEGS